MIRRPSHPLRGLWCVLLAAFSGLSFAADGALAVARGEGTQAFDAGGDYACAVSENGKLSCWGKETQLALYPPQDSGFSGVSTGGDHACAIRGDGALTCWGQNGSVGSVPTGAFLSVSAGRASTCGLRPTGELVCWNGDLAATAPTGRFSAVSLGDGHACAIKSDGSLACWDAQGATALGVPPQGAFVAVDVGVRHACALGVDGMPTCWGDNAKGQATPPANIRFVAIGVGETHSCGLTADRTVQCWGDNSAGQSTAIAGTFDQLAVGRQHNCARAAEGGVRCWGGANTDGQVNNNFGVDFVYAGPEQGCGLLSDGLIACAGPTTALTPPAGRYLQVSFGPTSACGVSIDRNLVCWGQTLGATPAGRFDRIAVGTDHACGLSANQIVCWGANDRGQATPPAGLFGEIVAGDKFSCAIGEYGGVPVCWGQGAAVSGIPAGQFFYALSANGGNVCGKGDFSRMRCWGRDAAGIVPADIGVLQVATGARHACAITLAGEIACYGDNSVGQTQAPSGSDYTRISAFGDTTCAQHNGEIVCWGTHPMTRPATGIRARSRAIAAGTAHTCTVRDGRGVGCWGDNAFGQFVAPAFLAERIVAGNAHSCGIGDGGKPQCWGDAQRGATAAPTQPVRSLDAGELNNCAVDATGAGTCWGWNANGQGNVPAGPFRTIATGLSHSCGIRGDGTLACWGYAADGQLDAPSGRFRDVDVGERHSCAIDENGALLCWGLDTEQQAHPPAGNGYRSLAVGAFHACALRADGSIVCWGRNIDGQATPPAGNGFVALAAGAAHTCAISAEGGRICWGSNASGQAPRPEVLPQTLAATSEYSPIDVTFAMQAAGYVARDVEWRLVSGGLPGGMRLETQGRLVGEPWGVGDYAITVEGRDRNGLVARRSYTLSILRRRDTTPPVVQPEPLGTSLRSFWFVSDVTLQWQVSDPESSIVSTTGCGAVRVTADTTGTAYTCTATSEGGTTTVTYIVRRDTVPPDTTLLEAPASPNYGVAPQRFVLAVSDSNPGDNAIECTIFPDDPANYGPCPSPYVFPVGFTYPDYATIPGTYRLTFRARDAAGNVDPTPLTYTWTILADTTPVEIEPVITGTPGENGWFIGDVSLHWRIADPETPVTLLETCADVVWQYDGYRGYTCTARSWGGRTQKIATLQRDTTRPNIFAMPQAISNAAGWYRTPVQVLYRCEDAASGVASCPAAIMLQTEGTAVTTGPQIARDIAGWTSLPDTFTARIDLTPPSLSVSPTTSPNANGWYRTDVLMRYTCSDALSGVVSCPADDLLTLEGSNVSTPTRTIFDVAGNAANVSASVKIDKTPPWISAMASTSPNANGWYRSNVVVIFSCGDALSGLTVACTSNEVLSTEGTNVSTTAQTVTDMAGNSTVSNVVTVKIDKTAPTVSIAPDRAPDANGWYRDNVVVSFTCADALSGLSAPCPGPVTVSQEGANVTLSRTIQDMAGNATVASLSLNIDKTAPTIVATMPSGDVVLNATHAFNLSVSDALSGVASQSCSGFSSATLGTRTATCTATDRAGNTTTRTSTYRVVYGFVALSAPLTSPTTTYIVAAPRSVPFEWRLQDANGVPIANATLQQTAVTEVACPDTGVALPTSPAGESNTFENFNDGRYRRNWWISFSGVSQCLRLDVTLSDGVTRSGIVRVVPKIVRRSTPMPPSPSGTRSSRSSPATPSPTPARSRALPVRRELFERAHRR